MEPGPESLHVERACDVEMIVAIDSTALGPALGGCRWRPYSDPAAGRKDALALAAAMTRKAALARLRLGGGKAVVIGDPRTRTRDQLLAFGDLVESLDGRYITAADMGTSEQEMLVIAERTSHVSGLASPLLFVGRRRHRIDPAKLAPIAFAFAFPLLFVMLRGSYVYNDARHVLFVYPPLVVCCALAFDSVLRRQLPLWLKTVFVLIVAGTMLEPLHFMIRNHPNQGVYFSPLIGGVKGAWRNYETDFWGNSVRQAVEWIQANTDPQPGQPVRIRSWYGDQTKAGYYIAKKPGYELVRAEEDSTDWDYTILQTVTAKYVPEYLTAWPVPGTVYEVKADGVPLCGVTLNARNRTPQVLTQAMHAWVSREPTHAGYFSLALTYRHYDMQREWIDAFRTAAELDPGPFARTHDAYVYMGQLLRDAGAHDESIQAYRLALLQDPTSAVASAGLRELGGT